MKRTKNMVYKVTDESEELYLYTVNDGKLFDTIIRPLVNNLVRKYKKGTYNIDKAVDAWYPIATAAAKQYAKEFCSPGFQFSTADRFTCAVQMEDFYRTQYIEA